MSDFDRNFDGDDSMTSQDAETTISNTEKTEKSEHTEEAADPSSPLVAANDAPKVKGINPSDYAHVSPEVLADAISIAMERRDDPRKYQRIQDEKDEIIQKEQMRDNLIIASLGGIILIDWVFLETSYFTNLILIAGLGGVAYAYWKYKRGTLKGQQSAEDTKKHEA